MLIEAGFDIAFECPAQTPMLLQLNVHPSRDADLRHGLLPRSAHRLRVAAAVRACGLWRRGVFPRRRPGGLEASAKAAQAIAKIGRSRLKPIAWTI